MEEIVNHDDEIDVIDPIKELLENNNIIPLLAIIHKIDLNMDIDGKPLLCILATKYLPLEATIK